MPPAVLCAGCGRIECAGCNTGAEAARVEPALAWEGVGGIGERLWLTALRSSDEPARTFGALPDGTLSAALTFALLAETLAIGSFAIALVPFALAVAPALAWRVLTHPVGVAYLLSGVGVASATMVGLHAIWGACLEFGAGASSNGLRQSLRFGFYACGWDLLTSPAGVLEGLRRRGAPQTFRALGNAIRAPRPALRAYQQDLRGFEPAAQRRALRLSIIVLGATLCALLPALGYALVSFAEWVFAL